MSEARSTYGEIKCAYRVLVGKTGERDLLEDPDVDGKIILKRTLRYWNGVAWTGLVWIRIRTCGGLL